MARTPNAARRNFLKTLGLSVGGTALLGTATGSDDPQAIAKTPDDATSTSTLDQRPNDWRMFRGDQSNSGSSSAAGVSGTPWVEWSTKVSAARDPSLTSPTVADGTAYAVDDEGLVTALDVETGETRWQTTVEVGRVVSPATVGDENVYVSSGGEVHALAVNDGTKQWTFADPSSGSTQDSDECTTATPSEGVSAVTVADGTAYVKFLVGSGEDRAVFALDAASGQTEWRQRIAGAKSDDDYAADDMLGEAPAVVGGSVYVSDGGSLFALDADAGTQTWRTDVFGTDTYDQTLSGTAVADGTVYLTGYRYQSRDSNGNNDGLGAQLVAVGAESGTVSWRTDLGSERLARPPAVTDGTVYVPSLLWAVNADSGSVRWKGDEDLDASVSVAEGTVYATTKTYSDDDLKDVVALDATNGDEEWRVPLRTPQMYATPGTAAVVDDTVYAADRAGYVYALSADDACWRSSLTTETHNSTELGSGTALVLDLEANLYAFDTTTEERRWKVSAIDGHVGEFLYGPVEADGMVYVGHGESGSESWTLKAFDVASGTEQWSYVAERGVGRPLISDGTVYFAGEGIDHGEPGVYALDGKTGDEVWTFARDESSVETYADVTGEVALLDGILFVPTSVGLWAFDAEGDRKIIFDSAVSTVAAAAGVLYVGRTSDDTALVEAVTPDGNMAWRTTFGDAVNVVADLTIQGDTVYAVGEYDAGPSIGGAQPGRDGKLYALSTADGSEQWTFDPEVDLAYFVERDQAITAPTVTDGSVFVGSDDRRVYELDADDGHKLDCFETFGSVYGAPATDGAGVYVGSADGQVYGFDR
ncbi:outer membrane protein assembly factor BamB family protein [Halorussus halophilus]|uniref:outer membrane protein assembly factor BamB family protein n=1 Tax=Halorussus halophilus TaxID=2650975 RepID=UPI0013015B81|nr:PQQ-binding-like beta-propeller repeat protein [Halorussus halophilus]